MPVAFEAAATASASLGSVIVCTSMPAKPTSFARANLSGMESSLGSIEMSTAFFGEPCAATARCSRASQSGGHRAARRLQRTSVVWCA
jgi:hypothetical protein